MEFSDLPHEGWVLASAENTQIGSRVVSAIHEVLFAWDTTSFSMLALRIGTPTDEDATPRTASEHIARYHNPTQPIATIYHFGGPEWIYTYEDQHRSLRCSYVFADTEDDNLIVEEWADHLSTPGLSQIVPCDEHGDPMAPSPE